MAYFECVVGSGGTGMMIPLVVTCTSVFSGLTITCTDGTTTLTDTCPSSSPYEITFNLPNTGTWTISGTISGVTFSESVLVEEFDCELTNEIDLTVDFYSAANDTVSYTGLDGQTHTITTDTDGHATATIHINGLGSNLTFTSSVAKNPDSLSSAYSKTITLTSATTSVYVMPSNALYWYGYKNNLETCLSANGWSMSESSWSFIYPTYNTNDITISAPGTSKIRAVGNINALTGALASGTFVCVGKGTTISTGFGIRLNSISEKQYHLSQGNAVGTTQNVIVKATKTSNSYVTVGTHGNNRAGVIYAMYIEE